MKFLLKFLPETPPLWLKIPAYGFLAAAVIFWVEEMGYFESPSYKSDYEAGVYQPQKQSEEYKAGLIMVVGTLATAARGKSIWLK